MTKNTTDTNQASEDERNSLNKSDRDVKLDEALGYITMVWDESSVFGQPPDYSHIYLTGKQEAKEAIQTLIRNEKLKLLDRLDKQIEYNKHDMGEMGEFIRTIYAHNAIEDERKQLEAEL